MKDLHIKQIMTLGGIVAVTLATSYAVRTYLDYLRIKQIKEELKTK